MLLRLSRSDRNVYVCTIHMTNTIDINEPVRILGYNSEKSWRSYAGSRERVDGNFRFHFDLGTGILCFSWSPRTLERYYFPKRLTFGQAQEMAEALLSGKDKAEAFIKLGYAADDQERKEVCRFRRTGRRYWKLFKGKTLTASFSKYLPT